MNPSANIQFITNATAAATQSGHVFPLMAAAEAALESTHPGGFFGSSSLARLHNNLFGTKQHSTPIFETIWLPTQEHVTAKQALSLKNPVQLTAFDGEGKATYSCDAPWIHYPTWAECFKDRMATLIRLKGTYPHYARALAATDPITYVNEVSLTWSTGPTRAAAVINIYKRYGGK